MNHIIDQLFKSSNPGLIPFSLQHIILLIAPIVLILLLVLNKERLKSKKYSCVIKNGLLIMLLIQQVLLYTWYLFTESFNIKDALPLYPCRICGILCIVLLIKMNKQLFDLLFFWGLPGATIALLVPDTSNLGFPNAMFIQFFIGHIGILVTIVYLLIIQNYYPTRKSLLNCYKISFVYVAGIIVFNKLANSNYAYLAEKPSSSFLDKLPGYPFHIPIFVGFMFLSFYIIQALWTFLFYADNITNTADTTI